MPFILITDSIPNREKFQNIMDNVVRWIEDNKYIKMYANVFQSYFIGEGTFQQYSGIYVANPSM